MNTWPTLVGSGSAAVLGLPRGFSLPSALLGSKEIRLATAFAHRSGWNSFKIPIENSTSKVFLLTGRDCFQTEPGLLKDWLQLQSKASDRVEAHLASDKTFFHPKVLVVTFAQSTRDFVVVGSANLSHGGMSTNTECSLFINDAIVVKKVADWFDAEFRTGLPLTDKLIAVYERDYKKYKKKRTDLSQKDAETGKKLRVVGDATMASWDRAIEAAQKYFATKEFASSFASRQAGAGRIRRALNVPVFDFDKNGWHKFYTIGSLGQLDERYRDKVWKYQKRLKTALHKLATDTEAALPRVLNHKGDLHVLGAGLNTISKILAALAPDKWPVYNTRVASALAEFGYKHPRGAGPADKYVAYRNAMKKFAEACGKNGSGKPDALALDAFFYMRSKLSKKKTGSTKSAQRLKSK